jgi:hypothetical protein
VSAPLRDLRFVSTQDGSTWERKGYDREGVHGLYALAGSVEESPRLWSVRELAELGLRGMTDVLPMPVGPAPRTLDRVEDELAGARLSLYEEELETARLRLALKAAKRGRSRLRAEVGELRAERHVTNEALDDAVRELRARRGEEPVETVTVHPAEDVTPQVQKLRGLLAGQRAALEDPHDSELHHSYRVGRDLPPLDGAR